MALGVSARAAEKVVTPRRPTPRLTRLPTAAAEDKMSECTVSSIKSLVYIDLDAANGERLQSLDGGATWIKSPIVGECGGRADRVSLTCRAR